MGKWAGEGAVGYIHVCKLSDFDSPHKARCQTAAKVNTEVTRGQLFGGEAWLLLVRF